MNQTKNENDTETNLYEKLIVSVALLISVIPLLYTLLVAHTEILNNPFIFILYFFELLFLLLFSISLFWEKRTVEYEATKKVDKMPTNDEIIAEINDERRKQQIRGAMLMLPTDPRAENYKDLIKAMDKARADERNKISIILNKGTLHSNDKAINDIIDYLNKSE